MTPQNLESTRRIAVVAGRLNLPPSYFLLAAPRLLQDTYNFSFHGLRVAVQQADFAGFDLQQRARLTPPGLYRQLLRADPDLIHQHWATWSLAAEQAARRKRIPLIVSVHGYDAFLPPSRGPAGILMDVSKRLERARALRAAEWVVVNSTFMQARLEELGVPGRRIGLIRHGVNTTYLRPDGRDRRGVLFVGRLSYEKGPSLLLDALSRLRLRADTPVTIVGDGPELQRLRAQASALNLDVRFAGRLLQPQVREELLNAEVVVVPSIQTRYQAEGSGVAPLEAMACGTPIVVTRVGGLPENVPTELPQLIADPSASSLADGIAAVLDGDWQSVSQAVRNHAVEFHSDLRVADDFRRLYESALGGANFGT